MQGEVQKSVKQIGQGIARWRQQMKEMNRSELARLSGVASSTIAEMEAGNFAKGVFNLIAVAEALGLEPSTLFTKDAFPVIGRCEAGVWREKPLFAREAIYAIPMPRFYEAGMEGFELENGAIVGAVSVDCKRWDRQRVSLAGVPLGARLVVLRRRDWRDYELSLRVLTEDEAKRQFLSLPAEVDGTEQHLWAKDGTISVVWRVKAEIAPCQIG